MTLRLSPTCRDFLRELDGMERERAASKALLGYTQIAGVSGESDTLRSGPGLVLTPQAGAAPRHEGKT